ncbi:hypothetical protein [Haloferax volcanii]|uniref:Major facilitator superfamily transport protein n=3 Tax=Haloferax volcanii TaxID=2246 RepID=D4GX04_HALVD|nr:hypothetical protein [Haloferax volcanii]ADE03892.1 major facilitator superfamily transport protein [Haloferax volcanii DS2]ELY28089.1 putative sugar transporter [Haloferax volcanii DS2]MBS8117666.1 sugar transporter [Haloferax volcanii]MBS8122678.1 sugar transporter [Haloferax volcanii]MBS8126546.1 sugar transporter [Haloferax volcanii]
MTDRHGASAAGNRDRWLFGWALGYAAVGASSLVVPLYAIELGASALFVGLIAATAGALALTAVAASPVAVLVANALLWFAVAAAAPVLNLIVVEGVPSKEWDRRFGVLNHYQGYGWLGGLVADAAGYVAAFGLAGVVVGCALVVVLLTGGRGVAAGEQSLAD